MVFNLLWCDFLQNGARNFAACLHVSQIKLKVKISNEGTIGSKTSGEQLDESNYGLDGHAVLYDTAIKECILCCKAFHWNNCLYEYICQFH